MQDESLLGTAVPGDAGNKSTPIFGSVLDGRTMQQMRCPSVVDANYDVGRFAAGACGSLVQSDGVSFRCASGHVWPAPSGSGGSFSVRGTN
jgi:hypothetical protein